MVQPSPLRILHLATPAPFGGLERVLASLALGHAARGHEVHVAAVVAPDASPPVTWEASFAGAGVRLHTIRLGGRSYAAERRAVFELTRRLRAGIAHSHGYRADVVASGGARVAGAARVSTVHGFTGDTRRVRVYEAVQRYTLRRFDAVVAVSQPLQEQLRRSGIAEARLRLFTNAWDGQVPATARGEARRRLGLPDDGFLIGWVGRLSTEKACDLAVRSLVAADPAVRLCVIGDGAERQQLVALAEQLGVGDRVHWLGVVAGAGELLPAFDALMLSSRTEGTPIVLLEAMAARVPIIATRVGGVPDVVSSDEAALVAPEDPAALARAITAVRQDATGAMTRAGRAYERLVATFSPAQWLGQYERLYYNLVERMAK